MMLTSLSTQPRPDTLHHEGVHLIHVSALPYPRSPNSRCFVSILSAACQYKYTCRLLTFCTVRPAARRSVISLRNGSLL